MAEALVAFGDTGVWRRAGEVLHQPELGYELTLLFAALQDDDLLGDDDLREGD